LKYLKWSYDSIRKHQGEHVVEICVADDASTDGTWAWCVETEKLDPNFKWTRNMGPNRKGHTILYDRLVNEVASHDICMIYHADMYLCPGALNEIEKNIGPKKIVSLTRIEPPLHPPGPEKLLQDFGVEPELFKEEELLHYVDGLVGKSGYSEYTEGIFAPWAFMKSDFQEIGGHDPLYAPQSKEDSDIFNRFQLNGVKFIQTWQGFVYHMTCRGSRFNPTLTTPGRNSAEWEAQNMRSTRNFIRKWGHFPKHDVYMKPIIPPKYNIAIVARNSTSQILEALEPWCDHIYIDDEMHVQRSHYIDKEQCNTAFNLKQRVSTTKYQDPYADNDIVIEFDGRVFNNNDFMYIQQISEIIEQHADTGVFELGTMQITINALNNYSKDLIFIEKQ
jgi:glycosyltransferase involved in cell wall biosynthesis